MVDGRLWRAAAGSHPWSGTHRGDLRGQPALWTSYGDVDQGAFDGYEDWARNNVFGLPALSRIPIRIDCGTSERFCTAAKQFANSLGHAPAGGFWDGGHNVSFWKSLVAADLTWLASLLTA